MKDDNRQQLGRYITEQRGLKQLSLSGLAEAAEMSKSTLSEIEKGLTLPQPDSLTRIAAALGIDWEDLYALAGYGRPKALPSFGPYLRSKYGDQLSAKELKDIERYFRKVTDSRATEDKS